MNKYSAYCGPHIKRWEIGKVENKKYYALVVLKP